MYTVPQSILEMAKELIQAQIEAGQLSVDDMAEALQKTHDSLMTLQAKKGTRKKAARAKG
jgi:hypothetical protein